MIKNILILSVSELTHRIKSVLEQRLSQVAVEGEISNLKFHSSGHVYFTLKDKFAQISAVLWRGRATYLTFTPQNGMKVIAYGSITVYEIQGKYQIDVEQLQPLGVGELQLAFERIKRKLSEEGLFDTERKRPIPKFPERIGIVTSPTGAVIRDMLNILSRRFPIAEVVLYPVKVQGAGAAKEIVDAIRDFNLWKKVDVIIIGRGGGSLEDLWAFNEEIVARAIYNSKIPIVSAVGHEIDYTIADFVADLRAPTPSAAAELVVPNKLDLIENLSKNCYNIYQIMQNRISTERNKVQSLVKSYSFSKPFNLIRQYSQRLDEIERHINFTIIHRLSMQKNYLISIRHRIVALNPKMVLKRGYAIVYENSDIISRKCEIESNQEVNIEFYDGKVKARIE